MPFQLTVLRHSCKDNLSFENMFTSGLSEKGIIHAKITGRTFRSNFFELNEIRTGCSERCVQTASYFIQGYKTKLPIVEDFDYYQTLSLGSFIKDNKIDKFRNYLENTCFQYYKFDKYNELFKVLYDNGISKYENCMEYYDIFSKENFQNQNILIITNGTNIGALLTALSEKYNFDYDPKILWPKYLTGFNLTLDENQKIEKIKYISFFRKYKEFILF